MREVHRAKAGPVQFVLFSPEYSEYVSEWSCPEIGDCGRSPTMTATSDAEAIRACERLWPHLALAMLRQAQKTHAQPETLTEAIRDLEIEVAWIQHEMIHEAIGDRASARTRAPMPAATTARR